MAANAIPLHCDICPKKPNFSDVSHLLTHIASKGHLSNYYKVKVRSSHETTSRLLIDAYDCWYAEWNVEELMSERMSQKDKRRTRARPAARPTPAPKIAAPVPRPARRATAGNLLDPRLSEQQPTIKLEHSVTPTPTPQPTGPVLRHRNSFAPHMQYWATESCASSRSYTNPDYETSSEYSDPSERRRYRYTAADSCAIEEDPVDTDPMAVSESTKLKGVYWPGMDIFDSATPEMRRKRNQKKDSSVVEQLELNSQEVEATELIFTPHGSFKRLRRISCSDSDDDDGIEIKVESPQPIRRRPALANMDVNAPRRPRQLNRPPMLSYLSRNQYDEDRGRPSYEYTHSDRASKRNRAAFNVFQDDDDDDDIPFSQPAGLTYLTSGFTRQHSPSPAPTFAPYKPYNDPFLFENKENGLPPFNQTAYGNFHNHHGTSYHYHTNSYGLGHEQYGSQYNGHLYNSNSAYQQQNQDDDDQRTITAPPSPSTS
ncbi:uncharacterized protein K460DRAFT_355588 [Cucurbitaria berberidis CBS 394.84]|uniref:Uncharacterized protein n=1 Tax=Cucurbitaria berberidis CBS 394.84 TaxID=1168544 RepID=A0A9P4GIK0_9PLEO|nr:uncharacterized protein K460DRAFT_355588 [Cucurbitaria berberidis CBS 394.84]KAF1845831.1 hypothetical protein K460DRAFT_355588 [Cucurbitaria berberidis CBS 394.84]